MPEPTSKSSTIPRVYVFDLDGVLYRGDDPVPGAADCLRRLRARQGTPARLFFLTNNSMQPRHVFADKLTRMGMPASPEEVVTSASATADYIAGLPGAPLKTRKALVVGGAGIVDELTRIGLIVRQAGDPEFDDNEKIDYVVCGLDREFTYERLRRAQQAILRGGATLIATNRDGQLPLEGDRVNPGSGSIVAAVEAASERQAVVIGKPEPLGLQTILKLAGAAPSEALMIGDRLDTDIACGNRLGVPGVLVLTGITNAAQAKAASPEQRPGRIINNLGEL